MLITLNKSIPRHCLAILLTLLLSSCTGLQRNQTPLADLENRARVTNLQAWTLIGKVGIRTPDEAASATINWSQKESHFDIFLSGPLGQGSTRIQGSDGEVSMQSKDEEPLLAESPEQLLYQTVGWQLPISELQYWVRGLVAPGSTARQVELNEDGTISRLHQQGWDIEYSRYQSEQLLALPARLFITRDSIKLTFIIKRWQLTP